MDLLLPFIFGRGTLMSIYEKEKKIRPFLWHDQRALMRVSIAINYVSPMM